MTKSFQNMRLISLLDACRDRRRVWTYESGVGLSGGAFGWFVRVLITVA